ncbi:MAG: hypothetical protein KDC52_05325 [Ignavibacteriae bacterium]|nr:hypothetical protein [Ignavibacteriota bacterium]MCB9211696.1 hypothetical protein [Ignavibacteriales bacterium]
MMKNNKTKFIKISIILNAVLFILSGISFIGSSKLLFGMIQLVAGFFNLMLLPSVMSQKSKNIVTYLVYVFNIIVAVTISIDYFDVGKKYIQYAWIIVALFSLFALIKYHKKINPTAP